MKYLIGLPFVFAIISMVLNVLLAGMLALTYKTLTQETPIVTITFEKSKNDGYIASLKDYEGNRIGDYEIDADQWQLDVGFYKMAYFANILGVESKYTLDRFEGRYQNIDDANKRKTNIYQIEDNRLVKYFSFFFDAKYGSSTYKDIKQNTLYTIYTTPSGIMVREKDIQVKIKQSMLERVKDALGL